MGINPQSENMLGNRCWDKLAQGPFWHDAVAEVRRAFGAWMNMEPKAEAKRGQAAEHEHRRRYEQLKGDREKAWLTRPQETA